MFEVFEAYLRAKISLTDEELELIRAAATVKHLRKWQYLAQAGERWHSHCFVCQGCLRLYRVDEKGQEHIISFAVENGWIGDRQSLLSGEPAQSNVDALEDSTVLLFTDESFQQLFRRIPAFQDMINAILARSFNVIQDRIHAAISYSAEEKYQDFLRTSPHLANRVPLAMIASYLGMTAETLSRVRKQLARK
ncbi:Crp/Fnr family transcriptional regulator [Hymenobacter sp. BT491]|uniref:Crp/Fnr family transcriptional regulator n=1 Tax=Hymenobacter sp. BT491 TaxID=2766779 RepID=UPI001653B348|nr:Crp/Fnr family transcriptional regulator [Hymenobacter sp. BT491]MBC6989447.1 Crp/Fnr family transcriptional regulator [Hymenobacter sp. BT491]